MSENAAPPAGWYTDPRNPAQQRYWDGTAWTQQVAPAAAPAGVAPAPGGYGEQPKKKGLSTGAIIAIVAGGIVLLGIILVGILAAAAMPVFNSQQAKAEDSAAKADVSTLGKEIATYYVEYDGAPPKVVVVDGYYEFAGSAATGGLAAKSAGVELGGQTGSGPTSWCVWVTAPEGEFKDFEYSAERGLQQGRCDG